MTIKLKTMLLPTGEFVLLATLTGRPTAPSAEEMEMFAQFRKLIGAIGCFVTPEDVEVEDALVDANARRVPVELELDEDEPEGSWQDVGYISNDGSASSKNLDGSFFVAPLQEFQEQIDRNVKDLAALTYLESYFPRARINDLSEPASIRFTADSSPKKNEATLFGDTSELMSLLIGGAKFSPAGLVADGPKTEADPEELLRGGEPGSDPEPAGVVGEGDWDVQLPDLRVGDRVRSIGPNVFDLPDTVGLVGTVLPPSPWVAKGEVFVQVKGKKLIYPRKNLELIQPEVETTEPEPNAQAPYDDLAALDEVAPDYAADTRLVDLVVRVAQAAVENWTSPSCVTMGQFFANGVRIVNDPWRAYIRELLNNGGVNTSLGD